MTVSNIMIHTRSNIGVAWRGRRVQPPDSPIRSLWQRGVAQAGGIGLMGPWLLILLTSSFAQAIDVPLPGSIPASVYEIELSYLGEQTDPTVTLNGPPDIKPILTYRPFVPILDLLPHLTTPKTIGPCRGELRREQNRVVVELAVNGARKALCGQRVGLQPARRMMDVLSYDAVHVRGQATGRIRLVLEDRVGTQREEGQVLATVTGPFDMIIPLRQVGRYLDMRQLTSFVVTTEEANARIELEQFTMTQGSPVVTGSAQVGFWVWDYRTAVADPEPVLTACRRQGCSRVLLQMPALSDDDGIWAAYARFFTQAHIGGIEAFALDGYPEAIQEPYRLADKIQRLLHLVESHALAGVQLDIEPYLLPGFAGDESGPRRYVECIDILKEVIGGRTRLSMVIPFWLTSLTIGERPLTYAVMDRVDEVAVMSYRTNLEELKDIADDTLRYGDLIGSSVWLAVETTPLPVERRVLLRRDPRSDRADAVLDYDRHRLELTPFSAVAADGHRRDWFRVHHRITVRPERVTFAGRPRSDVSFAVKTLRETLSHRSFTGVMIHDLDGFGALAE